MKLISIIALGLILAGCSTSQVNIAQKTLTGLEVATTGAYDSYTALVIKGSLATNNVPAISHAFNDFEASMQVAIVVAQANTNALATTNLVIASEKVINLITTVTGNH
jgi:hypothetical protein